MARVVAIVSVVDGNGCGYISVMMAMVVAIVSVMDGNGCGYSKCNGWQWLWL